MGSSIALATQVVFVCFLPVAKSRAAGLLQQLRLCLFVCFLPVAK